MSPLRVHRVLASLVITWMLAALAGAAAAQEPGPAYVGNAACSSCHADAIANWTGSHHDWALRPANAGSVLGDFNATTFSQGGSITEFFRDGDAYMVKTDGPDGTPTRYRILYTVGVTPLQQYLVETEPGRLQALDVAWDTIRKRWFHLYPDQSVPAGDGLHWTGSYKNWNARCADCHQTDFRKNYNAQSRRYDSTWSQINVGCEACHGPGAAHVAWARLYKTDAKAASEAVAAHAGLGATGLTIDFSADDAEIEIQRCAQCHSRREPLLADSPVPGVKFADAYRLARLTPELYFADGQNKDEVYVYGAFLQSRMYARGVRCTNCHEAHSLKLKAEGNGVCTQCHSPAANPAFPTLKAKLYDDPSHHHHPAGSPGAQCASCHMPQRTYMQVDARRDHSFRIPRPDLSDATGAPNTCISCHADKSNAWAAEAIKAWFPDGRHGETTFATLFAAADGDAGNDARIVQQLIDFATSLSAPGIVRSSAVDRLAGRMTADQLDRINDLLHDPDPTVRSAVIGANRGAPAEVRAKALGERLGDRSRAVRIDAARQLIDVPPQLLSAHDRQALGGAMADYRAALAATADMPETQMALGGLALVYREVGAAFEAFQTATVLDPGLVAAWRMVARIQWAGGNIDAAMETVKRGLAHNRNNPVLSQVKAGLEAARGDGKAATQSFEAAISAAPDDVALHLAYADFLFGQSRDERAIAVLTPLRDANPDNPELLFLLARSAARSGQTALAKDAIDQFNQRHKDHPLAGQINALLPGGQ